MGVIIRNAKGELMIAKTKIRSLCPSLRIESETTLFALRTSPTLGIDRLILEGDSMEVIKSMEGALEEFPQEIKICIIDYNELFSKFPCLNLKHVRREGNKVAHTIAKFGIDNFS